MRHSQGQSQPPAARRVPGLLGWEEKGVSASSLEILWRRQRQHKCFCEREDGAEPSGEISEAERQIKSVADWIKGLKNELTCTASCLVCLSECHFSTIVPSHIRLANKARGARNRGLGDATSKTWTLTIFCFSVYKHHRADSSKAQERINKRFFPKWLETEGCRMEGGVLSSGMPGWGMLRIPDFLKIPSTSCN